MSDSRRAKAAAVRIAVPTRARSAWPAAAPALFAAIAASPGLRFGAEGAAAGLLIAALATFSVFLPVIGVLSGAPSRGETLPDVVPTRRIMTVLLALWSATAWAAAAILSARGAAL